MQTVDLSRAWSAGTEAIEPLLSNHVVFEWWSGELPPCRGRAEVTALMRALADPSKTRGSAAEVQAAYEEAYRFLETQIHALIEAVAVDNE